ncbi:MAG: SCF ubiquitin ligase complex subunit [Claussenomyces sp. TS43310]|nr:MAG: SCF ubiquitin ligase complex subunit [Claussenomyces sp. TS43310]
MASIDVQSGYRIANEEEESQSSSSNSPTRADYEESDFFAANNDSQSSIGVPTFQDMAVTEEPCPPINLLPAEVMIGIFSKLNNPLDLLNSMLVCKMWARNSVGLLWHRPACTTWIKHSAICHTLGLERPYFEYKDFIKRLNLAALADRVNDGSVAPLAVCTSVERLTLTNCQGLTDRGLIELVTGNSRLLALDISGDTQITEAAINVLAVECTRLQGLNISGCTKISNESMIKIAENCRSIKRLKLNDCGQIEDSAILVFARKCRNILEIDLHKCRLIGNEPVTELLARGQSLRELRLSNCEIISDRAFLSLPAHQTYESLRILDLTSCARLTDQAVEKIISVAPRLRNLVLSKCRNITDLAVNAISKLGKNLHYVHLGHCGHITDDAVTKLVQSCNRIRYIDLGCCVKLTDASVTKLATLPKLRRIGLVKCHLITNESVYALSHSHRRFISTSTSAVADVLITGLLPHNTSSLERVHLSYCTNLTLESIIVLLNSCPRLTHLSLTGVQAFLRGDLEAYCREAPPEFTQHQREVFCVFSGQGVMGLRRYLNNERALRRANGLDDDEVTLNGDDDDQTMTGMMSATGLNGGADEEEDEADEELEDSDDIQIVPGGEGPA